MHPCVIPNAITPCNKSQSCSRRNFNSEWYRAIDFGGIYGYLNPIPPKIRKGLPRFNGMKGESAKKHLKKFLEMIENYEVDHEDVIMRLFL